MKYIIIICIMNNTKHWTSQSVVFSLQECSCLANQVSIAVHEDTVEVRTDPENPEPWSRCILSDQHQ